MIGTELAKRSSKRKGRIFLLGFFSVLWGGLLTWRLLSLQVFSFEEWESWALKQHGKEIQVASERGPIYDREGRLLAVSVPAGSVFVRPKEVKDRDLVITSLSDTLGIPPSEIKKKLNSSSPFIWIQRQIPREVAYKLEHIPGIGVMLESKRYYPYGHAASSLIGKVGVDGIGLSGLEAVFEKKLFTDHAKVKVMRDAKGNIIQTRGEFEIPKGSELILSLDAELQLILEEELLAGQEKAKAAAALGVLIDADTGEVLALGQSPSFNLNDPIDVKSLKNKIAETVIEPGSILKPIVAAAALDHFVVKPEEMIDCEQGKYRFAGKTIKDVKESGVISFSDVVVKSSNIGMTKVGVRLGKERLYHELRKFGLGEPSGLGLPGESGGILRSPKNWAMVDVATHSFGQGVAITPLQMVRAIAAIVNGGVLPKLSLKAESDLDGQRIISERAANLTKKMMIGVIDEEYGTGKAASIPGVIVGGKTGTAQKARKNGRGYEPGAYVASFAGFVEGEKIGVSKRLALVIMIDEPRGGVIYGGALAAPVFKKVMVRSLNYLATRKKLKGGLQPVRFSS